MILTPVLLGAAASGATLIGGWATLRWRRLSLLLAFSAGVVLGTALFDLLPEAVALGGPTLGGGWTGAAAALGLGAYLLLGRGIGSAGARSAWRAHLAPATLTLHSLFDGLGIGLAFQAGPEMGWVVAVAVLSHDIADGVNTVSVSLTSRTEAAARGWLWANGAAPLAGVLIGIHVPVSIEALALVLAAFGGAFLYISLGELVPRSRRLDPRPRTALASVAGLAAIGIIARLAP